MFIVGKTRFNLQLILYMWKSDMYNAMWYVTNIKSTRCTQNFKGYSRGYNFVALSFIKMSLNEKQLYNKYVLLFIEKSVAVCST